MNSRSPVDECRFPLDVEREIFEFAALSDPATVPSLMLVAQRVKQWVEPLLYRVIMLSRREPKCTMPGVLRFTVESFLRRMKDKSPNFLRGSVRHLCLRNMIRDDSFSHPRIAHDPQVDAILGACSEVSDLFLGYHISTGRDRLATMPCLCRLTLEIDLLFEGYPVDFAHTLFRNITHLEVLDSADARPAAWPSIAAIPNLTHLAFSDPDFCPIFGAVLLASKRLRCLVFLCRDDESIEHARRRADDARFVISGRILDFEMDWRDGAQGRDDYWDRADQFIAAKRACKIDGELYSAWIYIYSRATVLVSVYQMDKILLAL
ncbi:hypothetical protein DFH07DRAFT_731106 [Mycena maculata]|uniref:Uncharacterized protein n=1 Tax=Mycena maculata TaxID=230809 RepID=A0AAD7K6D2_9AGAR|nr:hypothetical protein DFH07DRAFT_731106 [Mycena maculata]